MKARATRHATIPTEHQEQRALFEWASWNEHQIPELRLMYAVPNGGARHKAVAGKLKAEGVKAGVPDICLPVARGGHYGLYVEMKRVKRGVVTKLQQTWHDALREQGYRVEVCKGFDEARVLIWNYLGTKEAEHE